MTVRIVRLGTPRLQGEGLRIGTVRHPPRGVPKTQYAAQNWYDVWFPNLAPSAELLKLFRTPAGADSKVLSRRYRAEMAEPDQSRVLDLLAALSRQTNFSVGCYCADDQRCHRSILLALLQERGAEVE
ncbi:DUF488 family protein [Candidatus Fermentibacteria bacterium]|nr:DUF488 family protein [Candidatus Fermentibacteria bacterium]